MPVPLDILAIHGQNRILPIVYVQIHGTFGCGTRKLLWPSPFAWRLDDQEIADVLTLVRSVWGNKGPAVDKAAIAKLRADLH